MKTALSILVIIALAFFTSCDTPQRDAAKDTLKQVGIQIAEAASKAAAEVALQAAEQELIKLEKSPVPENPLAAIARTAAIQQAWNLVAQARKRVADFHFNSGK